MSKLIVFNSISADGYFTDTKGDVSWAHQNDPEWQQFTNENVSGGGILLFGRVTYDMMQSYWPTPQAHEQFPKVADRMNSAQKVVFSRKLNKVSWQNTRLIKDNLAQEVRKLKASAGEGIVILGSGSIVSQLTQENLIDQYQLVVNPVVLGAGRTMFEGVNTLRLKRVQSRTFKNGNVLLTYERG